MAALIALSDRAQSAFLPSSLAGVLARAAAVLQRLREASSAADTEAADSKARRASLLALRVLHDRSSVSAAAAAATKLGVSALARRV